jgi:MurNAc alpha-1-phosphate uridylyltransferase
MKAMILAAGRGERMRPLTDTCPKPLLEAGGKPLIVWHIERLVAAGIVDLVINHAHLGHKLVEALGDGTAFGASIRWSARGRPGNRRRHRPCPAAARRLNPSS